LGLLIFRWSQISHRGFQVRVTHHLLDCPNVEPGTKELGAESGTKFVQEPAFALSGLPKTAIAFAAVQVSCVDLAFQSAKHVPVHFAGLAEDQRAGSGMVAFIFHETSQQVFIKRKLALLEVFEPEPPTFSPSIATSIAFYRG
jgi:hypothetical protein